MSPFATGVAVRPSCPTTGKPSFCHADLSPKSLRYLRGTLRTALNQAVRRGLVSRNAAALVDGPRVQRFEIAPFTPVEALRFLSAVRGHRLEALYTVSLAIGLRQGEALGLRWQDVDLEMGYLRVSKQLQRVNGQFELVESKTAHSRRTIVMPPIVTQALVAHRQLQFVERPPAIAWNELGPIFTRPGRQTTSTALLSPMSSIEFSNAPDSSSVDFMTSGIRAPRSCLLKEYPHGW